MRIALASVGLLACVLAPGLLFAGPPQPKKIRWTPIPHQEFKVENEVGALLTCAYKVVDAGQRLEAVDEESGLKIEVIKPQDGDLKLTVYWNHKLERRKITDALVAGALQAAVDTCFERLYGPPGDEPEEE